MLVCDGRFSRGETNHLEYICGVVCWTVTSFEQRRAVDDRSDPQRNKVKKGTLQNNLSLKSMTLAGAKTQRVRHRYFDADAE